MSSHLKALAAVAMKEGSLLCFFLLLSVRLAFAQYNATGSVIVPPLGNSPSKVVYTQDGYQLYSCVGGNWSLTGSYALLMDEESHTVAGNITSQVDGAGENYTFTIFNNVGDSFESGFPVSLVSGKTLAWEYLNNDRSSLSQVLLEATSHLYFGAAATVSYIQRYSTSGGSPPPATECTLDNSKAKVPYSAKYSLWTQDTSPAPVPETLVVQNGRFVEGFFGKGHVSYKYNGGVWEEVSKYAKLYNLPGTAPVGEYSVNAGDDSWKIFNPNGWTVSAQPTSRSVIVEPNCMPWTLFAVTSEVGVPVMLGPFTHVLMTSTRGGIAPAIPTSTGTMSDVEYSAIYWFFTE